MAELTAAERRLVRTLRILGLVLGSLVLTYLGQGLFGDAEYPFVANSMAKDGLFAALCLIAASDIRRASWAATVVVFGHGLLVAGLLGMLIAGRNDAVANTIGEVGPLDGEAVFWVWLALASAVTVSVGLMQRAAWKARYELRFLSPTQHRAALAMAEVLIEGDMELLTPEQVAREIDDYLVSFAARAKWKFRLALLGISAYPLLRGRPPFGLMSTEDRRRHLKKWFEADVVERRLPQLLRKPVQSMFYAAQQLVFIGYYSDPRTAPSTGYVPFSEREGAKEEIAARVDAGRPRVRSRSPHEIDGERMEADVVIVGSGAGGGILAYELAERGRRVIVVERGRHVDPSEFVEDERVQLSALFADGAMQLSADARFQVLQGMCVGGTTVVNNGVSFPLPETVMERWNDDQGLAAALDPVAYRAAEKHIRRFLPIVSQESNPRLNAGAPLFLRGAHELGLDRPPARSGVVDASIVDCLGCGSCNIGCPYGKKLSMLESALPRAQARYPGRLRVLAECTAEKVLYEGGTATGVACRLSDGRRLRVDAGEAVIVAAGALHSSLLLRRSRIGGRKPGRYLAFNMGAPMTAEFPDRLDAYAGLQISHYLEPIEGDGLILESWFNPVGAQALFMPGWFSDHFQNMRRYDHMACVGSVVGTRRSIDSVVKPGLFGRGFKLSYEPDPADLRKLVEGLKIIGRAFFAAGATKVMPTTYRYLPFKPGDDLDELDRHIRDNTDIQLHTSHPQGGNPMSANPGIGVVDPDLKVHGFQNLYVCDASVFPSSITVNPQMTIMSLARYCAERNFRPDTSHNGEATPRLVRVSGGAPSSAPPA